MAWYNILYLIQYIILFGSFILIFFLLRNYYRKHDAENKDRDEVSRGIRKHLIALLLVVLFTGLFSAVIFILRMIFP